MKRAGGRSGIFSFSEVCGLLDGCLGLVCVRGVDGMEGQCMDDGLMIFI